MAKTKLNPAAQALGALGGAKNTEAQQRARIANGKLGGRPRRVCTICREPVVGGHENRALDDSCGAHGWQWQRRADFNHPDVQAATHAAIAYHKAAIAALRARAKGER